MNTLQEYTQSGFLKRAAEYGYSQTEVSNLVKSASAKNPIDGIAGENSFGDYIGSGIYNLGDVAKDTWNDFSSVAKLVPSAVSDFLGTGESKALDAIRNATSAATFDTYIPYEERVKQELEHNVGRQSDLHEGMNLAMSKNPALRAPQLQGISGDTGMGEVPSYDKLMKSIKAQGSSAEAKPTPELSKYLSGNFKEQPSYGENLVNEAYKPQSSVAPVSGQEKPFSIVDLIKQHPSLAATGGGGALGALLGSQFGKDEDRGRNSVIGGALGAGAGYGLNELAQSGQLSKMLASLKGLS